MHDVARVAEDIVTGCDLQDHILSGAWGLCAGIDYQYSIATAITDSTTAHYPKPLQATGGRTGMRLLDEESATSRDC